MPIEKKQTLPVSISVNILPFVFNAINSASGVGFSASSLLMIVWTDW
jgi:hypothetical protein